MCTGRKHISPDDFGGSTSTNWNYWVTVFFFLLSRFSSGKIKTPKIVICKELFTSQSPHSTVNTWKGNGFWKAVPALCAIASSCCDVQYCWSPLYSAGSAGLAEVWITSWIQWITFPSPHRLAEHVFFLRSHGTQRRLGPLCVTLTNIYLLIWKHVWVITLKKHSWETGKRYCKSEATILNK